MEVLYATFSVAVSDERYAFRGRQGQAEIQIQVPREVLTMIDPGNLFNGVLQAALVKFDTPKEDEEDIA